MLNKFFFRQFYVRDISSVVSFICINNLYNLYLIDIHFFKLYAYHLILQNQDSVVFEEANDYRPQYVENSERLSFSIDAAKSMVSTKKTFDIGVDTPYLPSPALLDVISIPPKRMC